MPDPFTPRDDRDATKAALLEALPLCASLTEALALAELPSGTYHRWRQSDPGWAEQVDAAMALRDPPEPSMPSVDEAPPPTEVMATVVEILEARLTALEYDRDAMQAQFRDFLTAWTVCVTSQRTLRGLQHWARTTQGQSRGPLLDLLQVLAEWGSPGPEAA